MVLVTYSCIPNHPKTEYLQTVNHYCPFQSQGLTRLVGQFSLEVSHDIAVRWQGGTGVTLRLILVWSQEGFLAHISGFPGFPLSFSLHSLSSSVGLSIHMVVWHDCGLKIANSHTSSMALDFQERIMKLLCQLNLLLLWEVMPDSMNTWTAAHQASLYSTISQSVLKFMSFESVMLSNHLILCFPLLLLPSIFPSISVFSDELALHIRWPKYWSFSFNISPCNE